MKKESFNPVKLGKPLPAIKLPTSARDFQRVKPVVPPIDPAVTLKAFKLTPAAKDLVGEFPDILDPTPGPAPVAGFTVCGKTGTATYLDIWDCDHFDYSTDMGRNLSDCRVWFSSDEYAQWGSGQTKTGRINCYFRAPETRMYRCDATLQSSGGIATVECLMDNSSFGTLTVNGTITQPHFRDLSAGYHAFRIRQKTGSFFFLSLMVYAM
jgi:hypothetical protein